MIHIGANFGCGRLQHVQHLAADTAVPREPATCFQKNTSSASGNTRFTSPAGGGSMSWPPTTSGSTTSQLQISRKQNSDTDSGIR